MAALSFSRLQLAAALIEYDNDADDPEGPYRVARESAIFSHTRRPANIPRVESQGPDNFRRSTADFLNVKLPSEMDAASERRSVASGLPLQQGADVDLEEWGLGKAKGKQRDDEDEDDEDDDDDEREDDTFKEPERRRVVSEFMPGPSTTLRSDRRLSIAKSELLPSTATFPHHRARRSSLGNFGEGGAFLDAATSRRSFTEPGAMRPMSTVLDDDLQNPYSPVDGPGAIPFPSTEGPGEDNPFALPPPSPSKSSRFDPKANAGARDRTRTMSTASMGSRMMLGTGDDYRSSRVLDDGRSSRYMLDDGRSSHYFPADDGRSVMGQSMYMDEQEDARSRRMPATNPLRPKVLVMPSPLQAEYHTGPLSPTNGRSAFVHSKDGPPLPPGAKTERPGPRPLSGMNYSASYDPSTTQGVHLNPRHSLTLSQLTFRNSLMADVSYVDMGLKRAAQEGEKVTEEVEEEELDPKPRGERAPGALYGRSLIDDLEARKARLRGQVRVFTGDGRPAMMERPQPRRANTLIDPAAFENKRNTGLVRRPTNESSAAGRPSGAPLLSFEGEDTLTSPIDPIGAGGRMTKSQSTFGVDQIWEKELAKLQLIEKEERRVAEEAKRLEDEKEAKRKRKSKIAQRSPPVAPQSPTSKAPSERQMRMTSPKPNIPLPQFDSAPARLNQAYRRESVATLGAHNWFNEDNEDTEESEGENVELLTPRKPRPGYQPTPTTLPRSLPSQGRVVDESSEDEDIPLAARMQKLAVFGIPANVPSDSDEEELPLAAVIAKKQQQRSVSSKPGSILSGKQNSSPKPASFISPPKLGALPDFNFGGNNGGLAESLGLETTDNSTTPTKRPATRTTGPVDDSDDDNVPLGLRHPGVIVQPPAVHVGSEDEDEAPLGMRFPQAAVQQQAHQAQAQALQQQQYMMIMQQQMMWQAEAQARNSMAFSVAPSMMGMPGAMAPQMTGFGLPTGMPYGVGGVAMPIPPSASDPGKYNRVDRWRRDVGAVDE